jgi:hypothetical protein
VLKLFPDYASIQDEVHVRITDLPIQDKLRDLREVRTLTTAAHLVISVALLALVWLCVHT